MNAGTPRPDSVAIVGAGIIGLSIAWRLTRSGWRVTVFEAGRAGREASWAGAGMLAPGGEIDARSELALLAVESRALYGDFVRDLEGASGLSVDYQECGAIDLAYSQRDWQALQTRLQNQSEFGLAHRILTPQQIRTFWPRVQTERLVGGLFYPGDGLVNPRELITALKLACQNHGVSVRENCRVERIDASGWGVSVAAPADPEPFLAAVIAAGAWSSRIALEGAPPLPESEPVKGHLIGYLQPEQTCNTIIRHQHTYFLQRANGLLIVGASMEHVGFDREVRPERVAELVIEAGKVLPHLSETSPTEVWTGFRPGSDKLQLGAWHSRHLYLAYGHLRNGILLAPITAERIASELNANLQMRSFASGEPPR